MQHHEPSGVFQCQEAMLEVNRQHLTRLHFFFFLISAHNRKRNTLSSKAKSLRGPIYAFVDTQVTDADANCFEIKLARNRLFETLMRQCCTAPNAVL